MSRKAAGALSLVVSARDGIATLSDNSTYVIGRRPSAPPPESRTSTSVTLLDYLSGIMSACLSCLRVSVTTKSRILSGSVINTFLLYWPGALC